MYHLFTKKVHDACLRKKILFKSLLMCWWRCDILYNTCIILVFFSFAAVRACMFIFHHQCLPYVWVLLLVFTQRIFDNELLQSSIALSLKEQCQDGTPSLEKTLLQQLTVNAFDALSLIRGCLSNVERITDTCIQQKGCLSILQHHQGLVQVPIPSLAP